MLPKQYVKYKIKGVFDWSSSSISTTALSWVSACSTVVEHSQQEGFYRVPLPAAHQTPQLGGEPGI
jgi:hypothetical protein